MLAALLIVLDATAFVGIVWIAVRDDRRWLAARDERRSHERNISC